MTKLLPILFMSILLPGELEVDGNLKVTGTIQNDSLAQVILLQQQQISALEARIAQLECLNSGNIPEGYCDCFGNINDVCGECGGDAENEDECYSIYDYDGNGYTAVQIGNQVWLAENLKVDHYRNGDPINFVDSSGDWATESQGNYSYYNYSESLKSIYGNLYNWYAAVDSRNICPDNFRIPENSDWFQLIDHLGGDRNTAGSKLKETGYDHWNEPNTAASDEYGFRAIPGGKIEPDGLFYSLGVHSTFWTTAVASHNSNVVHMEQLYHDNEQLNSFWVSKMNGYSVRCIQE